MANSFVIIKIAGAAGLEGLERGFPGRTFTPVYKFLSGPPGSAAARLGQYFQVRVAGDAEANELVNELKASDLVANAYVRGCAVPARGRITRRVRNARHDKSGRRKKLPEEERRLQAYLRPGTIGVNAFYAWDHERTRGQNVRVADVELGWDLGHVDLPRPIQPIGGSNRLEGYSHGLAVLGILVARDSQAGLIGIAPRAEA